MRSLKIWIMFILISFLILGFNTGCQDFSTGPSHPNGNDNGGGDDGIAPHSEYPPIGKVEEPVQTSIFKLLVKSVISQKKVCDGDYTAKGKYIILDIEIKNIDSLDRSWFIDRSHFTITDNTGKLYTTDFSYDYQIRQCLPGAITNSDSGRYAPGQGVSGRLIFDVDENASGLIFKFHPGIEHILEVDLGI